MGDASVVDDRGGSQGSRVSRGGGGDSRVVDDDGVVGGEPGRSIRVTHRAERSVATGGVDGGGARRVARVGSTGGRARDARHGTALGDPIEFGAAVAVFAAAREGFARFERFSKGAGCVHRRTEIARSDGKDASAATRTAPVSVPVSGERDANTPAPTPNTPTHTVVPAFLSGIKSARGHAEAAAGAWGLIHAASQLTTRRGGATNHLREINPHVARVSLRRIPFPSPRPDDKTADGRRRTITNASRRGLIPSTARRVSRSRGRTRTRSSPWTDPNRRDAK